MWSLNWDLPKMKELPEWSCMFLCSNVFVWRIVFCCFRARPQFCTATSGHRRFQPNRDRSGGAGLHRHGRSLPAQALLPRLCYHARPQVGWTRLNFEKNPTLNVNVNPISKHRWVIVNELFYWSNPNYKDIKCVAGVKDLRKCMVSTFYLMIHLSLDCQTELEVKSLTLSLSLTHTHTHTHRNTNSHTDSQASKWNWKITLVS